MKFVINDRVVLLREPEGPLAPYIVPLWKRVIDEGYAPCSVRRRIRIVVGFSRWLAEKSVCLRSMSSRHFDSYRDTFRQFLKFAQHRLHKLPSALGFEEIDAPLVVAFLDHVERHQGLSARSRNLRLTAIHSFFVTPPSNCRPTRRRFSGCSPSLADASRARSCDSSCVRKSMRC
jgi:Phage integrase, N-terminal SAM-like domain